MLRVWRVLFARRTHDERGSAEFATALMVLPVLFILIVGCVEIGFYVQTRMRVENIARDAARQVAAQGGNYNEHVRSTDQKIDDQAFTKLWDGSKCKLSQCAPSDGYAAKPEIRCDYVTGSDNVEHSGLDQVQLSGETVTCKVKYPYNGLSGHLMDGAMGLGIGGLMKPFTVSESARSETGTDG